MEKPANRYQHLDIARGIGIILVVIAHNRLLAHMHGSFLSNIILPFHMPLFFLLTGVFIKESEPFKITIHKKFNTLLLPYIFSITLVVILEFLLATDLDINFLMNNLKTILYSTGGTLAYWAHLWFLTSLFTTIIFLKIAHKLLFGKINNIYMKSGLLLLFPLIGYLIINGNFQIPVYSNLIKEYGSLPWSIDLIPVTFFYMYLGFMLKSSIKSDESNFLFNNYSTFLYLIVYILLISNDHIDLNQRKLNHITIDTIQALLGIFIVIGISRVIANSNLTKLKVCLSTLGQLSLIIYIFHYYIQFNAMELLTSYGLLSVYSSAIFSFAIGIISPIAIYFFIINKFTFLRRIYGTLVIT